MFNIFIPKTLDPKTLEKLWKAPALWASWLVCRLNSLFDFQKTATIFNNIKFSWFRWIPACAQILIEERQQWIHLVPSSESDSTALVQQFFACLAALMSTQLRSLVINSLADFVSFLSLYKVINAQPKINFSYELK